MAALVLAVVLASRTALSPGRAQLVALGALLALAAWAGSSGLWSAVPTLSRDESLLTALYAVTFAVPLVSLADEEERLAAVGVIVAGLAALAVADAFVLAGAGTAGRVELFGRLDYPIDYVNGLAALFAIGIWPALVLAAQRRLHPGLRALAFGAAGALAAGFLLTQSKGSAVGLVTATVIVLVLAPDRIRYLVPAGILAALGAIAYHPLTGPYRAVHSGSYLQSVHHAGRVALVLVAVAVLVGLLYALVDRKVRIFPGRPRLVAGVALGAVVLGLAAGAAAFLVREPRPIAFAQAKWAAFKRGPALGADASSHFLSLGSNRYDFWRVALVDGFERHPLIGVGARGFGPLYLLHRRSTEFPRRTHSLELEVLAELGLVGFALLVTALGIPLVLAARDVRRPATVAALGGSVCWLAQASFDWTWTLPATGIPFFLLLGIGAVRTGRPLLAPRTALVAAAATFLVALLALAPPWLSSRLAAHGDFTAARRLDPISPQPYVDEAFARSPPSVSLLATAVAKEPRRAELHYLLAQAELAHGERAAARRELRETIRLDPTDPVPRAALRRAR